MFIFISIFKQIRFATEEINRIWDYFLIFKQNFDECQLLTSVPSVIKIIFFKFNFLVSKHIVITLMPFVVPNNGKHVNKTLLTIFGWCGLVHITHKL